MVLGGFKYCPLDSPFAYPRRRKMEQGDRFLSKAREEEEEEEENIGTVIENTGNDIQSKEGFRNLVRTNPELIKISRQSLKYYNKLYHSFCRRFDNVFASVEQLALFERFITTLIMDLPQYSSFFAIYDEKHDYALQGYAISPEERMNFLLGHEFNMLEYANNSDLFKTDLKSVCKKLFNHIGEINEDLAPWRHNPPPANPESHLEQLPPELLSLIVEVAAKRNRLDAYTAFRINSLSKRLNSSIDTTEFRIQLIDNTYYYMANIWYNLSLSFDVRFSLQRDETPVIQYSDGAIDFNLSNFIQLRVVKINIDTIITQDEEEKIVTKQIRACRVIFMLDHLTRSDFVDDYATISTAISEYMIPRSLGDSALHPTEDKVVLTKEFWFIDVDIQDFFKVLTILMKYKSKHGCNPFIHCSPSGIVNPAKKITPAIGFWRLLNTYQVKEYQLNFLEAFHFARTLFSTRPELGEPRFIPIDLDVMCFITSLDELYRFVSTRSIDLYMTKKRVSRYYMDSIYNSNTTSYIGLSFTNVFRMYRITENATVNIEDIPDKNVLLNPVLGIDVDMINQGISRLALTQNDFLPEHYRAMRRNKKNLADSKTVEEEDEEEEQETGVIEEEEEIEEIEEEEEIEEFEEEEETDEEESEKEEEHRRKITKRR